MILSTQNWHPPAKSSTLWRIGKNWPNFPEFNDLALEILALTVNLACNGHLITYSHRPAFWYIKFRFRKTTSDTEQEFCYSKQVVQWNCAHFDDILSDWAITGPSSTSKTAHKIHTESAKMTYKSGEALQRISKILHRFQRAAHFTTYVYEC